MDKTQSELAEVDYMKGMKYQGIADKYNVSINTVKSWKTRCGWNKKGAKGATKKVCTQIKEKKGASKKEKDNISIETKEVMKNDELNEKQKLFCIYYSKCFNATKAYQKAYECGYNTAAVEGNKHLKKPHIKAQIEALTEIVFDKASLTKALIQKYIDIAFADITEYIQFGEDEKVLYDKDGKARINEDGELMTEKYNYVKLGESNRVDGSLITEVSEGRDGIKIKLADKMKAMDFLSKHCNLLNDEEKTQLDIEYKKLQNDKLNAEISQIGKRDKTEPIQIVIKRKEREE